METPFRSKTRQRLPVKRQRYYKLRYSHHFRVPLGERVSAFTVPYLVAFRYALLLGEPNSQLELISQYLLLSFLRSVIILIMLNSSLTQTTSDNNEDGNVSQISSNENTQTNSSVIPNFLNGPTVSNFIDIEDESSEDGDNEIYQGVSTENMPLYDSDLESSMIEGEDEVMMEDERHIWQIDHSKGDHKLKG